MIWQIGLFLSYVLMAFSSSVEMKQKHEYGFSRPKEMKKVKSVGHHTVRTDGIDTSKFFVTWKNKDNTASVSANIQFNFDVPTATGFDVGNDIDGNVLSVNFYAYLPNGDGFAWSANEFLGFAFKSPSPLDFSKNLMEQPIFGGFFGMEEISDFNFFPIGSYYFEFTLNDVVFHVESICAFGSDCYAGPTLIDFNLCQPPAVRQYDVLITEKLAMENKLTLATADRIGTSAQCIGYLAISAVNSLTKIVDANPSKPTMVLERAYQGPFENLLSHKWQDSGACPNRIIKNLLEDPIQTEHSTGCAIDLTAQSAFEWKDALISKGWLYTRPTIYKHHFEYLKCTSSVTQSDGISAFQQLWNEAHSDATIDVTGVMDEATLAASGSLYPYGTAF